MQICVWSDENATDVQGCHEALIEWIERHEHIAVIQQSVIIMLQVATCSSLTLRVLPTGEDAGTQSPHFRERERQ